MNLKTVRDVLVIAAMKSLPGLKRQPFFIVLLGLISAIPLFFMSVTGGQIRFGLIGCIVGSTSYMTINSAIQDTAEDRYTKMREMIVAMPVGPLAYALGQALSILLISLPSLLVFLGLSIWMGATPVASLGWLTLIVLVQWGAVSCIGFTISTYFQKSDQYTLNTVANMLGIALTFLPPVYYAEETLGSLSWISILFPTSNAAGLIRFYSGSLSLTMGSLLLRWGLLLATMLISVILLVRKSRWREN